MRGLFDGWQWSAMNIKNVVNVKTERTVRPLKNRGNTQAYQLGIKFTGHTELRYNGEKIDYSPGTVVYLPKETTEDIDYSIVTTEGGNGACIFFESELPLPTEVQIMRCAGADIEQAFLRVLKAYTQQYPYPDIMEAFYSLIAKLLRASTTESRERADARFEPALRYMSRHWSDGFIDIRLAALECAMTEKYFRDSFKSVMQISPLRYFHKIKMMHARELISDLSLSIAEVAELCGFSDPNYFSRFFKKESGVSPSEYRNYYCKKI